MTKNCYKQVKELRANPLFKKMSIEAVCIALLLDVGLAGKPDDGDKQHVIDIVRTTKLKDIHE